jgi:hypothetical protein
MSKWMLAAFVIGAFGALPAASQSTEVDGLVSVFSRTDRGSAQILLENLPAGREIRVHTLQGGAWQRVSRAARSVPGASYNTVDYFTHRFRHFGDQYAVRMYYRARATDGGAVSMRIIDNFGRVHCESSGSGDHSANCVVDVPHRSFPTAVNPRESVFSVQAENRGATTATVVVEGFGQPLILISSSGSEAQVDPLVPASGNALVTLPFNLRTVPPGRQQGSLLRITEGDGRLIRDVGLIQQWDGTTLSASPLVLNDGGATGVFAGSAHTGIASHRRLVFLVPNNLASLAISVTSYADGVDGVSHPRGTPHDIALHLFHVDRNAADAAVPSIPSDRQPDLIVDASSPRLFPDDAEEKTILTGNQLKTGLWYAVPVSKTGIPLNLWVEVQYPNASARALEPQAGHFFNPARPGHGFYLGKAGAEWVLIWYTYDREGQPVWYYAQGPKPSANTGGSQWSATLYRNVWNGQRTRFQFVGFVQIAAQSETEVDFAHIVDGELGVQRMRRLGPKGCSQQWAARPLDVNGLWYSPQKPGYGFSTEVIGDTEFFLAYAYDATGRPRWVTAQQSFNASTSVPLLQSRGSCPTCTFITTRLEDAGTLTRDFVPAAAPDEQPGFGKLWLDARWVNGISGAWTAQFPVSLLSARTGCR